MNRLALLDKWALFITLVLASLGVVLIRSATQAAAVDNALWLKQGIWLLMGLVFYFLMAAIDYKKFVNQAHWIYLLGILSLVLVLQFGDRINGARSWFRLPFMSIQPSEFMKIAMALVIARYFSKFQERQSSPREFIGSAVISAIPFVLIVLQPDLGTALVYLPFFLVPNFLIGKKESIWVTVAGIGLVGLLIMGVMWKPGWVFFLKDYQKDRIVAFIHPNEDTSNKGYQVHQSKISIGQGGLFGMGLGEGQQTRLGFLPAQHNDFILAVAAEETGFVGILLIFGLYMALFLRGFNTALEARDTLGSLVVIMVIGTLLTQTLFNAAMLIGLVPTTGIPCPLISYGGSSFLTTMGLLGLVQSVQTHRFVNA